jgi:glycolate oxidase
MKQRATLATLPPTTLSEEAAASMPRFAGDRAALLAELRRLLPADRLLATPEDLFAYECDAQTFDRALPLAVALPETTDEVAAVVKVCARHGVPFVPRGAGTGLSGGAVAVGSVLISTACTTRPIPPARTPAPSAATSPRTRAARTR